MDNIIVYNEGGDSYRPFIIIQLPPNLWITPNISFYRTTGRSNAGFSIYRNTWFPTPGLITTDVKLKDVTETLTKGHIIKCKMLGRNYKEWHKELIRSFLVFAYADEIDRELEYVNTVEFLFDKTKMISSYLIYRMKPDELKLEKMYFLKRIIQYVVMLNDLLYIYFSDIWQLKLSCILGGGIWTGSNSQDIHINQMLSRFRGYVNNIEVPIINQIRIPNIENIPSTEAEIANEYHVSESNEDSVISFLEMNHAQISKEDLENITTENSKTNRENKENYLLYYRNKLLLNTIDDYIKKIIDKKKSIIPSTMVISREPIPSSSPSNTKTRKRKSRESPKPSIKKNHQITKKRKITGGYNKRPKKQLFISSRILHK